MLARRVRLVLYRPREGVVVLEASRVLVVDMGGQGVEVGTLKRRPVGWVHQDILASLLPMVRPQAGAGVRRR